MKRNQKGVTLIALVITIIVMLILAAASVATLTGDSGVITNAQKAQAGSTEGEVVDKMNTAYSSVKTEAMVRMATEVGYKPVEHIEDYIALIQTDLEKNYTSTTGTTDPATSGYGIYITGSSTSTTRDIVITYKDTTFALTATTAESLSTETYPQNNQYAMLEAHITFTTSGVSYTAPTRTALQSN